MPDPMRGKEISRMVRFRITAVLFAFCVTGWAAEPKSSEVYWNRGPLSPNAMAPLPLGSVKPAGWLRQQLKIQANGLSGHLDEFWPDLGPNSGWLGGTGESWERGPYYLDGFVPLAYLLDDPALIAKAKKWVEWTLTHQREDGAIGPDPRKGKYAKEWQTTDWWPNMVMLKVLTQYQEATGDSRVIPLMRKYMKYHLQNAQQRPLINWASHRWAEELLSIVWLYNRTGDKELLDLARALQPQGYDWRAHFSPLRYTSKLRPDDTNLSTHVVNNAMAMKTSAVWWLISADKTDRDAIYSLLDQMDRYHGQVNGVHGGDEHYAGLDPSQGTELCAVVEGMFSLEQLLAILGDPAFGDRLERITFNALPATFKPDMWAHQYDQQVNQVMCSIDKNRNWTTNEPDSNLFGLEPNFGCCTANMHQGWPKFVSHLWMATRGEGLAAVAYAPSSVNARVRGGVAVKIDEATEYPFRETIRLTVRPGKPVMFPLTLRVPAWAKGAVIKVAGRVEKNVRPGTFHTIERRWRAGDIVEIRFPMALRSEMRYKNSIAILRGPLVFSLAIGEDWRKVKGEEPHADWEVHPATPWNYGLVIDPANPSASISVTERPVGAMPLSPDGAPVALTVTGRRIPEWTLLNGSTGPIPESPLRSDEATGKLTLIPYGCTNLRLTLFPWIQKGK